MTENGTAQYLYQFHPGERPELSQGESWTEQDNAIANAHFEYLKQAHAKGIIILAGRSLDWEGPAVVIFEAPSQKEALHFMANDPFVKNNLFKATLHPFRAALVK